MEVYGDSTPAHSRFLSEFGERRLSESLFMRRLARLSVYNWHRLQDFLVSRSREDDVSISFPCEWCTPVCRRRR